MHNAAKNYYMFSDRTFKNEAIFEAKVHTSKNMYYGTACLNLRDPSFKTGDQRKLCVETFGKFKMGLKVS
jgi:hypothetical protein